MKKCNLLLVFVLLYANSLSAQLQYERAFRIRKSQFPEKALLLVQENVTNIKKLKFYKEIDASKTSFDAKFKKDRSWYSMQFSEGGTLGNIALKIKNIDIPEESYAQILTYLEQIFSSYKIKNIQQQYVVDENDVAILRIAFQNLITPNIKYELLVQGKKNKKGSEEFKILFHADGSCVGFRKGPSTKL